MKKYSLLLLLILSTVMSYAAVVQGTVVDANNQPVANQIVYVHDTFNTFPSLSLQTTTNASGAYSVTIPSSVTNGTLLKVSTGSCGMLITNSYVYQGTNITSNFQICASNPAGLDTISGTVTAGTGGAFPCIVYLIEEDFDTANNSYMLNLLDSGFTTQNGDYMFLLQANNARPLLVKAAMQPGAVNYANYLPTYHTSSLNWSGATPATFVPGNTNIQMIAGTNPGGPGFIGGDVLQGANKTTNVGDPLNKRLLILTTAADVPVAYTYSDMSGAFSFSNLAYGTYKLFGDAWGKLNPALLVTISATNPSVTNIVFEENSTDFTGHIGSLGISAPSEFDAVKLYPNPATEVINITGMDKIKGNKNVALIDAKGSVIWQGATNGAQLIIPVSSVAQGIYMIQIKSDIGTASYKMIK